MAMTRKDPATLERVVRPKCKIHIFQGEHSEKKYRIIWELFPNSKPPQPPLLETPRPKKNQVLFCILGPNKHFWFSMHGAK